MNTFGSRNRGLIKTSKHFIKPKNLIINLHTYILSEGNVFYSYKQVCSLRMLKNLFKNLLIKRIPPFPTYFNTIVYFNTISPLVYHIFSQRVVYTWGKGWWTMTEWLVPDVPVLWGHDVVPANPDYDGVQGLTLPMSWGPNAPWWSSCPGSVYPEMGPWSW